MLTGRRRLTRGAPPPSLRPSTCTAVPGLDCLAGLRPGHDRPGPCQGPRAAVSQLPRNGREPVGGDADRHRVPLPRGRRRQRLLRAAVGPGEDRDRFAGEALRGACRVVERAAGHRQPTGPAHPRRTRSPSAGTQAGGHRVSTDDLPGHRRAGGQDAAVAAAAAGRPLRRSARSARLADAPLRHRRRDPQNGHAAGRSGRARATTRWSSSPCAKRPITAASRASTSNG